MIIKILLFINIIIIFIECRCDGWSNSIVCCPGIEETWSMNIKENICFFNCSRGNCPNCTGKCEMSSESGCAGDGCIAKSTFICAYSSVNGCGKNIKNIDNSISFDDNSNNNGNVFAIKKDAAIVGSISAFSLFCLWSWISRIPAVAQLLQRIHKWIFKIPTDSERIENMDIKIDEILESIKNNNTTSIINNSSIITTNDDKTSIDIII